MSYSGSTHSRKLSSVTPGWENEGVVSVVWRLSFRPHWPQNNEFSLLFLPQLGQAFWSLAPHLLQNNEPGWFSFWHWEHTTIELFSFDCFNRRVLTSLSFSLCSGLFFLSSVFNAWVTFLFADLASLTTPWGSATWRINTTSPTVLLLDWVLPVPKRAYLP